MLTDPGCGVHLEETQGCPSCHLFTLHWGMGTGCVHKNTQRTHMHTHAHNVYTFYVHSHTVCRVCLHTLYTHTACTYTLYVQICKLGVHTHTYPPTLRKQDGTWPLPSSCHLHRGPGSLSVEKSLMSCGPLFSFYRWGKGAPDRVREFLCHGQCISLLRVGGRGMTLDSTCTEMPSSHHAPGTPQSHLLAPHTLLHSQHCPFSLPHFPATLVELHACTNTPTLTLPLCPGTLQGPLSSIACW